MNMKNSVTSPKKTTKLKRLTLLLPFLMLLVVGVTACDSNSDQGTDNDDYVYERNGRKYMLHEITEYPDSVRMDGRNVPCRPVRKSDLPSCLKKDEYGRSVYDIAAGAGIGKVFVFQGQMDDSEEIVYNVRHGVLYGGFELTYLESGNGKVYQVFHFYDTSEAFLEVTSNWKCIHIIDEPELVD